MIGGEALVRSLVACGVEVCFMNPGTSEMHFVAALDAVEGMRGVLALFEGVATGAADGYARMTGSPASTLLHLGPGLGNGLANLHNARRAFSPVVAVVGDHATYHKLFDAPLESDIVTVARSVSRRILRPGAVEEVGPVAAEAVHAAAGPPGGVATVVLPADMSWSGGAEPAGPLPRPAPAAPDGTAVEEAAAALRSGQPCALLLGGSACRGPGLAAAAAAATHCDARILAETFPARLGRGAGIAPLPRLPYLAEMAASELAGLRHLILVGAKPPASFFAYPGKPSALTPEGCVTHVLAEPGRPCEPALDALVATLGAPAWRPGPDAARPALPSGPLTVAAVNSAVGALLPEGAVVSEEAATSGFGLAPATAGSPPHDWLTLTGGAIGQGLPVAVGAAVACPERKVVALQADGGSLYTIQSLWTMAREGLDVTVVLYNNRSYAILNMELERTGAGAGGPRARRMLDLSDPDIDFVSLARGFGVPAERATTGEEMSAALQRAFNEPGPALVEAIVAPGP